MSLIAHWKMNDSAASTAVVDETGVHAGVAEANTNTKSVPGRIGSALAFNGSTDWITVSDNAAFDALSTSMSAGIWVNASSLVALGCLFGKYIKQGDKREWLIDVDTDGTIVMLGSDDGTFDDGHQLKYVSDGVHVVVGRWTHVGFTWAAGTLLLYINGDVVGFTADGVDDSIVAFHQDTSDITVGMRLDEAGSEERIFTGSLDDLRIYNTTLTSAEMKALAGSKVYRARYAGGLAGFLTEWFRNRY